MATTQTPDVEASQQALLASLAEPFASALSSAPSTFPALAADHARLVSLAYDKVLALKEFNSENEEWDWKARVELDDEDADDEDEGPGEKMQVEAQGAGARAWTPQEVQAYLRTGKKPAY